MLSVLFFPTILERLGEVGCDDRFAATPTEARNPPRQGTHKAVDIRRGIAWGEGDLQGLTLACWNGCSSCSVGAAIGEQQGECFGAVSRRTATHQHFADSF